MNSSFINTSLFPERIIDFTNLINLGLKFKYSSQINMSKTFLYRAQSYIWKNIFWEKCTTESWKLVSNTFLIFASEFHKFESWIQFNLIKKLFSCSKSKWSFISQISPPLKWPCLKTHIVTYQSVKFLSCCKDFIGKKV